MKHVVVCLALVAMIFAIGCQENDITSPITTAGPAGLTSGAKLAGGVILLNGEVLLEDRDALDGSWTIAGQVAYTLTPVLGEISVDISLDGSLTPTYIIGNSSPVSGQSSDLIQVPGSQPVILDKKYVFDGGNGQLEILNVRYSVSDVSVSIDGMWVTPLGGGLSVR